jgi:hypothetical protein
MSEIPNGVENHQPKIHFKDKPSQEGSIDSDISVESGGFSSKLRKALIRRGYFIRSTRETQIPGTEINRGIVERFERGELYKGYMQFKREIEEMENSGVNSDAEKARFKQFREQSTDFKKKLDLLNRQFYPYPDDQNKWDTVHIEDDELGKHDIPVVTLDLYPPKEGVEDKRTPYFMVPMYLANPYQAAFFAMSLALQGEKVHVMTYPEKYMMSGSDRKDWLERVRQDGTLRPFVKLSEKIIDGLNLSEVNLIGTSMGAPIVLEMASDSEFAGKVKDVIVVDPPSLVKKGEWHFLFDFLAGSAPSVLFNREVKIKSALSERKDLEATSAGYRDVINIYAPLLAKAQITPEIFSRIKPKGKFEIWIGGKSSVTGEKTKKALAQLERQRIALDSNSSPLSVIELEGARHQNLFATLGMASVITRHEPPQAKFTKIGFKELARNGAESILRDIRTTSNQS